jgi:hypothetical protein
MPIIAMGKRLQSGLFSVFRDSPKSRRSFAGLGCFPAVFRLLAARTFLGSVAAPPRTSSRVVWFRVRALGRGAVGSSRRCAFTSRAVGGSGVPFRNLRTLAASWAISHCASRALRRLRRVNRRGRPGPCRGDGAHDLAEEFLGRVAAERLRRLEKAGHLLGAAYPRPGALRHAPILPRRDIGRSRCVNALVLIHRKPNSANRRSARADSRRAAAENARQQQARPALRPWVQHAAEPTKGKPPVQALMQVNAAWGGGCALNECCARSTFRSSRP